MIVRSMDVERMQAAMLAAEAVQQEQRSRKANEDLQRQMAEVQELKPRPGSAGANDAAPLADRQRAAERPKPRSSRRNRAGEATESTDAGPAARAPSGRLIDEYR